MSACGISYLPMTAAELYGALTVVLDGYPVCPDITIFRNVGMFIKKIRLYCDSDVMGCFTVHKR
jgi:hypothetical protein